MMEKNRNYAGIIMEDKGGKALFQLRDNKENIPHPNKWSLFGGGIKRGESPEQAILREIYEELSFKLDKKRLQLLIKKISKNEERYVFYYQLKDSEKSFKLKEGQSYSFISPYRLLLRKNVVPSLRLFLLIYPFLCYLKITKFSKNSYYTSSEDH